MSKTRIERKLRVGVTGVAFAWNWFHHLQAGPDRGLMILHISHHPTDWALAIADRT